MKGKLKHWPIILFLIGAFFGAFNIIHESFHIIGYFLETGRIGVLHWFYIEAPGAGDLTYVAGCLGDSILCGSLLIFGNRWLKYYGFSIIMTILTLWYGSVDYEWIRNIYLDDVPIVICVVSLAIALAKWAREAEDGQRRTDKVYNEQAERHGAGAQGV